MVAITKSLLPRQNLINTQLAVSLFTVSFIFTLTSIVSVGLRLWAKRINKSKIVIEDYLCITSLIFVIGQFICITCQIELGGMGHHYADLPPQYLAYVLQILVAFQSLYCLAVATVKCSICFFYIRIFAVNRVYRITAYCVIAFIAAWAVMSVLVAFLSCTPFAFTWDPTIPGGHCDNQVGSFVAEAVLDLVADLMVFALPLKPIWNLQINSRKKGVLFVVFGLGITTMIMAILRIVGLSQIDYMDFTYTGSFPLIYSILEPAIGISVACIPLLQPIFKNTWFGQQLSRGSTRPKRSDGSSGNFKRLGDEYAMRSFEPNSVSVSAKGGPTSFTEEYSPYEQGKHSHTRSKSNQITVKREFMTDRV